MEEARSNDLALSFPAANVKGETSIFSVGKVKVPWTLHPLAPTPRGTWLSSALDLRRAASSEGCLEKELGKMTSVLCKC